MNKDLFIKLQNIISQTRTGAVRSINSWQVSANYLIGQRLVEHEQGGQQRAKYGKETLVSLSSQLTHEFGRGFSATNLELMRKFYKIYSQSDVLKDIEIPQTVSEEFLSSKKQMSVTTKLATIFTLSWSHYVCLMTLSDSRARDFYALESAGENWSLRELKRQIDSALFERLALSTDKKGVKALSEKGQLLTSPTDAVKEPYILEFLGLDEKAKYSESDLEAAIIDKIEHFLLELGKGFLFEARQKRFTFDDQHFYVDLVFYNRLLKCYVLIDLKIGKLKHQDLGQMQMYVNYFDRFVKLEEEMPTIGIILCQNKSDSLIEITLPKNSNIHASKYQLYLPSKEELQKQLLQAEQNWENSHD